LRKHTRNQLTAGVVDTLNRKTLRVITPDFDPVSTYDFAAAAATLL
jgi:hypothetical protein